MGTVDERSFGTVIRDIGGNVDRIVRTEMRIAIAELRDGMRAAGNASQFIVAGIACATLAAAFMLLSGMIALARLMPMWAAALAVSSVAGAAAALFLRTGRARIVSRLAPPADDIISSPETFA